MNVEECIKTRRSVRKYNDNPVDWDKVTRILDAGKFAPSAGNIQNWRFIVVEDEDKKEKVAKGCLGQKWMTRAGVLVVVCSDDSDARRIYGEKSEFYCRQNCAAAMQNMLLKAYSIGIASCWIGAFSRTDIKKVLKIPDNISEYVLSRNDTFFFR